MKLNLSGNTSKEILKNNIAREHRTLGPFACYSGKASRKKIERIPDRENIRGAFSHDADRIIHSLAYTRYIDKTQVFYLFENDHITHRVLHVQLVSKIARTIGRFLRLNEDLIEAIALGHDLGHVPYGHNGERKLDRILQKARKGYFIHNAQSVRALMELENKGKGQNLSLQVLDGILCHNGEWMLSEYKPQYDKTWDTFEKEYNFCWTKKNFSKKVIPMTLEGCVVRISDVIAYIGRDFEDAIMLGLIKRREMPAAARKVFGDTNRDIIDTIVLDLVEQSYGKDHLLLSKTIYGAIKYFYDFSKSRIYANPRIGTEDKKIDSMFDVLYATYLSDIVKNKYTVKIITFITINPHIPSTNRHFVLYHYTARNNIFV